jgi:glycosyltransferase involved in cell wall biosynthesis
VSQFALSYVLTTKNKLLSLQEAVRRLLENVRPDEEAIIVDGGSTDGSAEFLADLHRTGKIHQFISGPDVGEAHGANKGFLAARGDLVKVLSDDDVFYWPVIRECREFMMRNPDVDWLTTNGAGQSFEPPFAPRLWSITTEYAQWLLRPTPISVWGLGEMFRRSSLPLLGLYNVNACRVDLDYSLRNTTGIANFALYTGCGWIGVANPRSGTRTRRGQYVEEGLKYDFFYGRIGLRQYLRRRAIRASNRLRRNARAWLKLNASGSPTSQPCIREQALWPEFFRRCEAWLERVDKEVGGEFLMRPKGGSPSSWVEGGSRPRLRSVSAAVGAQKSHPSKGSDTDQSVASTCGIVDSSSRLG